jgi:putative transposase
MDQLESLSHSVWECKYHVAFIPKCRRKVLYESLRQHLGEVFKRLAEQKECRIGRASDARPCAYAAFDSAQVCGVEVVGFIKGKSAIHLARTYGEHKQNFAGSISGRGLFRVDRGPRRGRRFANTSATRRLRTSGWTSSRCGSSHRKVAPITSGPR